MGRRLAAVLLLLLSAALAGCDHATKHLARRSLSGGKAVEIVPGWFNLRYAENHDTAFSLTRAWGADAKPIVLAVLATAMIGVLLAWWWRERRGPLLLHLGAATALGGALGNVIDRLFRGYVIDFLHVRYWPIFNVADVAVVIGLGLVMLSVRARGSGASPSSA
jgi:signal peptidase II